MKSPRAPESARRAGRGRETAGGCRKIVRWGGLLLAWVFATPVLVYAVGFLLFGHRDTWNVGQGETFVLFCVGLASVVPGMLYWLVFWGLAKGLAERRPSRRRAVLALGVLWTVVCAAIITVALLHLDPGG